MAGQKRIGGWGVSDPPDDTLARAGVMSLAERIIQMAKAARVTPSDSRSSPGRSAPHKTPAFRGPPAQWAAPRSNSWAGDPAGAGRRGSQSV
jgi:hypothetical protein